MSTKIAMSDSGSAAEGGYHLLVDVLARMAEEVEA